MTRSLYQVPYFEPQTTISYDRHAMSCWQYPESVFELTCVTAKTSVKTLKTALANSVIKLQINFGGNKYSDLRVLARF